MKPTQSISTDSFTHKVTTPAWRSKPSWYMVASADRSINPEQERMMAKRAGAKTVEVNASHVAYMSGSLLKGEWS
jgi:hypothetical protein